MKNKKYFKLLVILITVLSFTPFIQGGCSGGGGGGDDGNVGTNTTSSGAGVDASGVWMMSEQTNDTVCGGMNDTDLYSLTITQSGTGVTAKGQNTKYFIGQLSGNQISWTGEYYDSSAYGWITVTNTALTVNGNNLSGTADWEFRETQDGPVVCSGTSQVSGLRVPDDTSGAFVWNGLEWQPVNWNEVTTGLGDFEKLALTDTVYALSDSTYYQTECTSVDYTGQCADVLLKSIDGGKSWEKILATGVEILAVNAYGPTLFVADHYRWVHDSHCKGNLYRSQDGGKTWETVVTREGYGLECFVGETVLFNNEYFNNWGNGVTNLTTGNFVVSFSNQIRRLVNTDSAMYLLSWDAVYESLDGTNWYEIGDGMNNIASFGGVLYAFPE